MPPVSAPPSCCVIRRTIASRHVLRPTPIVRPLVLLLRRLVVACHVISVAGIFAVVAPAPTPSLHWHHLRFCAFFGNQKCQHNDCNDASATSALARVQRRPRHQQQRQCDNQRCQHNDGDDHDNQRCQRNDGNHQSGLEPLWGSTPMIQIVLSPRRQWHASVPSHSEGCILPILESVIDAPGNSINHV
jgi:hypothetical protein